MHCGVNSNLTSNALEICVFSYCTKYCWHSIIFCSLLQNIRQASGSYIFLSERELEDLCKACGLVGFTRIRNRAFVMISATKPT